MAPFSLSSIGRMQFLPEEEKEDQDKSSNLPTAASGGCSETKDLVVVTPNIGGKVSFGFGFGAKTSRSLPICPNMSSTSKPGRYGGVVTFIVTFFGGEVVTLGSCTAKKGAATSTTTASVVDIFALCVVVSRGLRMAPKLKLMSRKSSAVSLT